MRRGYTLLRAAVLKGAVLSAATLFAAAGAFAEPLITLNGQAGDARSEEESTIRLSVLSWTDPDQIATVVGAYNEYSESEDSDAFLKALEGVPTQGYLFTAAASGYTVKYAWKEESEDADRMVFLVTPALKTRNPVLWKTPNTDERPFTLVELHWEGEEAVMKTSLDTGISSEGGLLQLENFDSAPAFADMADNTPYYYSNRS